MDREGFRNRLKQYKKAREENPGLKYYDFMERLAEFKAKEWGDNPDMVLQHMLNDNTYNYRQMYEDNPNYNIEEGHFTDKYKTVYHPTFSNESMYSGKKSEFNPRGTIGGRWSSHNGVESKYWPSYSLVNNNDFDFAKTELYLRNNGGKESIDWYYLDIYDKINDNKDRSKYATLNTYYPFISDNYKWTGHSSLIVRGLVPNTYGDAIIGTIRVDKGGKNPDYSLITNNCSDATRCALEHTFNKKINPFLFTTPGDVQDFALDELNGVPVTDEKTNIKGRSMVRIPINEQEREKLINFIYEGKKNNQFAEGGEVGDKKAIPTQEEYIAEQIAAKKAAALEKSLSRTMPRVPQGIKTGERWNPVTKKVEDILECGPSCAYTFSDNYGLNWMGSEDFKQNHANYGWKQVPWEQRQPGDAVLIVDDKGTARHTMMYDSDNAQGQPLFNHSNGGHDESAIRKKAKYPHHNPYLTYEFVGTPADSTQWINDYKKIYGYAEGTDGVRDNTYVAPIEKEQVFIPATGAMKFLQEFRKRNPRGGNLEIVSPEFDLLTFGRSIGNAIYKNLPTDMVYRRTTQSEIDDIFESGVFRKLPEGKVAGKGKTFTINGKTVTLHKKGGNAHGGKAFSKGEPWRGTTVTGTADEVIVGIPGKGTRWKVGHHGDYSNHAPFEKIEKGKGLWEPFNERGIIENISPKGMRVFRPFAHGYKEDGLLPITGLNLIGENIDQYADGGEVTGPPTYEQWDADMNQYNPTILDNASMYWSIEAAKKALHNEAMKLPGYAERWTEYYRSLPKNDPDINEFVDELWANENPNNVGLKNGKYYPHKSPEGGKPTIGPGFKIGSGSHRITKKQAERGMTKARLNQEARYIGKQHLNAVDQFINYGQTTNPADTVSPQIKMGLMDLRHQVGPLNEWGNLRQAVLNGDLEGIRKESTVTWNDDGKIKVDKRRKKIRDEKYFYYE